MRSPHPQSCQTEVTAASPCPLRRSTSSRPRRGRERSTAWEQLLEALPGDLAATAQATGALQRRRKVRSAAGLLWLVLAYAVGDWSLRLVAGLAEVRGVGRLSHVAVRARLRTALPLVQALVSTLLGLTRSEAVGTPLRLRLVDATTSNAPGNRGTDWRVHASLWITPDGPPRLDHLEVTDAHGAERLWRHQVAPGDVLVADRGYSRRTDLGAVLAPPPAAGPAAAGPPTAGSPPAQVHVLVRLNWQSLPLQHPAPDHARLDLLAWLSTLQGPAERPVVVACPQGAVPLRLVAVPLPEAKANAARRRLHQTARRKGRTPDARSLLTAGYLLLVTTLPATQWDTAAVLALYRVRWQVELAFKRLKGLWHLDRLRAKDPALAQVYLLGTLLGAVLADRAGQAPRPTPSAAALAAWFLTPERPVSLWRWAALGHTLVLAALLDGLSWTTVRATLPQLRRHLCDPPRQRPQQAACTRALLTNLHSPEASSRA